MADAVFSAPYQSGILEFDPTIHPDVCRYQQVGRDLLITYGTSTDSVTVQEFFWDNQPANVRNPISAIHFMANHLFRMVDQILPRPPARLLGTAQADSLCGSADADILEAFAGDDLLEGRGGNDHLDGGDGVDTASYATATGGVRVDLSLVGVQDTGSAGSDVLVSIENLIGSSFADVLRGNAGANRIDAGAGDDLIDGGAGEDTLSYASAPAGVSVNLALTTAQATGGAGRDTIQGLEHLIGSRFADVLTGSAGPNALQAGEGNDLLWGSLGADRHSGGPGADRFLYRSEAEAGNGVEGRDWILDFQNDDRIDLTALDANPSRTGDQAFSWIGSNAFKSPGQLRYTVVNGLGLLEGNTIGTSGAEFQIAIQGGFALRSGTHVLL
jgi:Ca2+-binding RTX toxin-like protein